MRSCSLFRLAFLPLVLLFASSVNIVFAGVSSAGGTSRPEIIGVAHIGLKTGDMAAARKFYGHDLRVGGTVQNR